MIKVYYNEFDKKKCAALSQLMKDGHISKGDIDDRSIRDVQPEDLQGYDRCHFFAGIGLWDYALNLAGWEEGNRVWTGSCPCQPFSPAGRQKGKADDRHLWPEWERLIKECKPSTIFGEQVASAITKGWLDDVYQGLEAEGYAVGSAVLSASSVGAPHRRERLWFVAYGGRITEGGKKSRFSGEWLNSKKEGVRSTQGDGFTDSGTMGDTNSNGRKQEGKCFTSIGCDGSVRNNGALGNSIGKGSQGHSWDGENIDQQRRIEAQQERSTWEAGIWIDCPDGKKRLVEPRIRLLAHGYPERVGIIHSAGDAIVPQVATEFIIASMEALA